MNTHTSLKIIIVTSLAIVLGKVALINMPLGGSINLSCLPIISSSFLYNPSWGILIGFVYSITKLILCFKSPPILNPISLIAVIFLDYIIPYSCLGLSSIFKVRGRYRYTIGILFTMIVRLISTTLSGVLIWKNIFYPYTNIFIYSIIYNSIYIVPETVLSIILCPLVVRFLKNQI